MFKYFVLILTVSVVFSESYKILGIFPVASRSHHNLGSALLKGLAEAGHDVTIVTAYEENYVSKKGSYREVVLTGFIEQQEKSKKELDMFGKGLTSIIHMIKKVASFGSEMTEQILTHKNFQELLNSNETFDATIVEQFVIDALKGLSVRFNSHQIILNPVAPSTWVDHLVGNPALPSFVPEILSGLPAQMTFYQRLVNTIVTGLVKFYYRLIYYPSQDELFQKYISKSNDENNFYDCLYNVSLILLNGHPSIIYPHNTVPNMVNIGGFHIKSPKKLPKDLQEYLDNSKKGVVYFSLGSVVESKNMPVEKRNIILNALGKLDQDVLWKWEEDTLPGQPKNVRIEKWLPQESILAHPNVKLFVTHGGLLSTIEAIYYGMPTVAIPVGGDQKLNAKTAEQGGYGKVIPFSDLSEEKLVAFIEEVISNPTYRENAKYRSLLLRDRQVSPLQTAIYWVEYVIRHNGAKHLRVASLDLAWYQYYLFDVLGFLLVVSVVSFYIFKKVLRCVCCSKKSSVKKQKLS